MNEKFVYDESCKNSQYKYKYFRDYDTSIIKSITGTGKTTAVAQHIQQYKKEDKHIQLISITARQSLSAQHVCSFKELNMKSYLDKDVDMYCEDALTICINSLPKLSNLTDEDMNHYILYIDEVASFLELSHNDTLDNNLKEVYHMLVRFIKHAKKVIVSDALINDAVFELLRNRDKKKMIFIENNFKKYEGVSAVRIRNEDEFLSKLLENCSQ